MKGVCIICHGSSNANAIKNAIRVAKEQYEGGVNQKIEAAFLASINGEKEAEAVG